ncbi:unnamed protein product, partial [Brassica oleracea]
FYFLYCIFTYYLFFLILYMYLFLFNNKFFPLMWTPYGASKAPFLLV